MGENTTILGQNLSLPGNSPAPSQDAGASGDANASGDASGGERIKRSEQRIGQLTAQKYELARALEAANSQNSALIARLEALETRVESVGARPNTSTLRREWKDLREEEMLTMAQEQAANDPTVVIRVSHELARREVERQLAEARKGFESSRAEERQRDAAIQRQWTNIVREFGPDVQKADSPIYKKADEIASALVRERGQDVFNKDPLLLYHAFAEADRQLSRAAASSASRELERLRAQGASSQGGAVGVASAAEASASLKDLLAKNDVRGAVGQLDIVRSLRGLPPKSDSGEQS